MLPQFQESHEIQQEEVLEVPHEFPEALEVLEVIAEVEVEEVDLAVVLDGLEVEDRV